MRKFFSIIGLLLGMHAYGQFHDTLVDGMPSISVKRQHCVIVEEGLEGDAPTRTASVQEQAPLRAIGSPKIVVCLAQFKDVKFTVAEDAEGVMKVFDTFFNGKNVGAGDNPFSVADYFRDMSGGLFTPEFVVVEPVTLSNERAYYGEAKGSSRRVTFRDEALDSLALKIGERVGELDTDEDGKIDGVVIVFTGCGANVGDEDGMHPACWSSSVKRSGITYATELVAPELLGLDESASGGADNAKLNGIGVFVHEISHMLGLPDFYDLNYKAPGMDYWSLMDYGEYWHNGYRPTPYTAYERSFMGWTSLVELSEPAYIESMKSLDNGGSAYVIYNDGNRDEFYVLENRNANDRWGNSLCTTLGSGMMIYHVDYNASKWSSNRVNTEIARQRMTIVPANGHFEICDNLTDDMDRYLSELRGHLWPLKEVESVMKYWGLRGNNALTDEERTEGDRIAPAARLNTLNTDGTLFMHKPITDISFNTVDNTVSFSFMGGSPTGIDNLDSLNGYAGEAWVKVYGIDGRLVMTCRESDVVGLPAGVYVVRNMLTGETMKRFLGR